MKPLIQEKIITKQVYDDNYKQINARQMTRQKRIKGEESYNNQVTKIQDAQFEDYKKKALSNVGQFSGGSGYAVIKNAEYVNPNQLEEEFKQQQVESEVDEEPIDIENYKEEEEKIVKPNDKWKQLESAWSIPKKVDAPSHAYDDWLTEKKEPVAYGLSKQAKQKLKEVTDPEPIMEFQIATGKSRKGKGKKKVIMSE